MNVWGKLNDNQHNKCSEISLINKIISLVVQYCCRGRLYVMSVIWYLWGSTWKTGPNTLKVNQSHYFTLIEESNSCFTNYFKPGARIMTPLCTTGWLIMALFWSSCWIMPPEWVISSLPWSRLTPWFILALPNTHTLTHTQPLSVCTNLLSSCSLSYPLLSPHLPCSSLMHLFIHEKLILWMDSSMSH